MTNTSLIDLFPRDKPATGKLGAHRPTVDPRTLKLKNYKTEKTVSPPSYVHRSHIVSDWGMLMNDELGDCVPAAALHTDELFNKWAGHPVSYTDKDVLVAYESPLVGSYVPGDPSTDNGASLEGMLKYWYKYGLPGTKNKAGLYMSLDWTVAKEVKTSVYEFGVAYVAFALPVSAQGQLHWDVPAGGPTGDGAPWSWGGHCVPICSYDSKYLACITWGGVVLMTWAFLGTYCVDAYAILAKDQLNNGVSKLGLSYQQMKSDLAAL